MRTLLRCSSSNRETTLQQPYIIIGGWLQISIMLHNIMSYHGIDGTITLAYLLLHVHVFFCILQVFILYPVHTVPAVQLDEVTKG